MPNSRGVFVKKKKRIPLLLCPLGAVDSFKISCVEQVLSPVFRPTENGFKVDIGRILSTL